MRVVFRGAVLARSRAIRDGLVERVVVVWWVERRGISIVVSHLRSIFDDDLLRPCEMVW